MTLRLILTRHAKSSWDDPLLADHERGLNPRGRAATAVLGQWMNSRGYLPDAVYCSDARRTQETWEGISRELPTKPPVTLRPDLYQASPEAMLRALHQGEGKVMMMLGHNPGIAEFAARLLARQPSDPDFARYPTGATLIVDFDVDDWMAVNEGEGTFVEFNSMREIEA